MISDNYTIGMLQSDKKHRLKPILVFGNKPQDIVGYTEAINSDEMYVPHHIFEKDYTMKELKQMNRYDVVPSNELVWLPQSFHNGNREIHKGFRVCKFGSDFGVKRIWKKETKEKHYYVKYEKIVDKLNNDKNNRLRKIRFENVLNRTDISRQRKSQICSDILFKIENRQKIEYNKNLKKFEFLLDKQSKLKYYMGPSWWKYETELQKLIEVL